MSQKKVKLEANERIFVGLSKQNMLFHQCVFELVDNAIAAAKPDIKIHVQVAFEAIDDDDDSFYLYVSDNGLGMDLDTLADSLQLGHEPTSNSRLNEHGFGLKNSLATLSGGNGEWTMWTRSNGSGNVLMVKGPFASEMIIEDDASTVFPNKPFISPDVSTVVMTKVKKTYAQTVQGRGARTRDLSRFRQYLLEHLGVAYRGYLSLDEEKNDTKARIEISIGNDHLAVSPINIPIARADRKYFSVELAGKTYKLEYVYGTLDDVKRDALVKGQKAKYYYQGNMSTQGIDIRLGDRVIATRQFETIWRVSEGTQLQRDNHYNKFVGELLIPELPRGVLSTVNNKTDFNLDDPGWMNIFDILNGEEYRPTQESENMGEKELRESWAEMLRATSPTDEVLQERHVWYAGVRIDVYRKKAAPDNSVIIYELKVGSAAPLNLYQLKMYWDGLLLEGIQPDEAVLLVESYSDLIENMANTMNRLTPPNNSDGTPSSPYNFSVKKHSEVGLGRRR